MAKSIYEKANEIRSEILGNLAYGLDEVSAALESPIERALFWALVYHMHGHVPYGEMPPHFTLPGCVVGGGGAWLVESHFSWLSLDLWAQVPVVVADRSYRLDFAIEARRGGNSAFVNVECDGHDFRERTKEQAERDKRRDRDLQSIGYRIARFTGSEIYRSPEAVAVQVISFVDSLLQEKRKEEQR